jgi:hypothetical protein
MVTWHIARTACVAFACSMASAQAAEVIRVSTSLSDLTYQVRDLSEVDGKAAGITFLPGAADGLKFYLGDVQTPGSGYTVKPKFNDTTVVQYGALFGTGPQTVALPGVDAEVAKAGANFTARAAYSAAELSEVLATAEVSSTAKLSTSANQLGDIYLDLDRYANVGVHEPSAIFPSAQAVKFRMDPFTEVTFSAVIKTEFLTDLLPLIGTDGHTRLLNLPAGGDLFAQTVSAVVLDAGFVNQQQVRFSHNQYLDSRLDTLGNFTSAGQTSPSEQTLSLTMTNNRAFAYEGSLQFSLRNEIHLLVRAVPEPGTWATFALGLVGVAGAVRRRKLLQA